MTVCLHGGDMNPRVVRLVQAGFQQDSELLHHPVFCRYKYPKMEGGILLPLPLWTKYACHIHWGGSEIESAFNVKEGSEQLRSLYAVLLLATYTWYQSMELTVPYSSAPHVMHCYFTSPTQVVTMHHNVIRTMTILFPLLHTHSLWD